MSKMYIGQKVVCRPETFCGVTDKMKTENGRPKTGKIIYIHPRKRWIVVSFGPVRESFFVWDVLQFGR